MEIRRWGPGRGSRQAVQVGIGAVGGCIDVILENGLLASPAAMSCGCTKMCLVARVWLVDA